MILTLFGIVMLVSPVQLTNALLPMLVTGLPLNVLGILAVVIELLAAATVYELPPLFRLNIRLPEVVQLAASADNDSAQQTETATASVISRQMIFFFIVFFLSLIEISGRKIRLREVTTPFPTALIWSIEQNMYYA